MAERVRGRNTRTPAQWGGLISAEWRKAAASIIRTGELLLEAKQSVRHGEWGDVVDSLPFGHSTANKLMAIAENKTLTNSEFIPKLPPAWSTLYELSKLPDGALVEKFADDTIHAEIKQDEAVALVKNVTTEGPNLK